MTGHSISELDDSNTKSAFAAEMTNRQCAALRRHLDGDAIRAELNTLLPSHRTLGSDVIVEVRKWLSNGWNTERLMCLCQSQFNDQALLYALHWAFPQAYYSVYATLMAFLKAAGATEATHAAVLRKHGELVAGGRYPKPLSPYAHGSKGNSQYKNITRHSAPSTLHLDDDPRSVETQICQVLNATRQIFLDERRRAMRSVFQTARKKPKKSLTKADWARVASAEGNTTLLHFLYRKRIKANYRDIETYLHDVIDPRLVIDSLVHVVSYYNLVHEAFVCAITGEAVFSTWIKDIGRSDAKLSERLDLIRVLSTGRAS